MSRKSMTSSDPSTVSVQAAFVNLPDSHKQLPSVKAHKKRVPERFGECNVSNGWIRCASRFSHGRDYFYNTVTGAKSWMYPVSQKIGLSNYKNFMVPGPTLRTSSQEDESPLALSSSEQPLPRNFIEILKVLNKLYCTPVGPGENQYNSNEDDLHSAICNTVFETCLDPQGKAEQAKNCCDDIERVAVCEKELDKGGNKKRDKNNEIYFKTAPPVDQSHDSTSSSSSNSSTTSSSNSSSTTSTNYSTSISTGTTEATAAPPASTLHFLPPLPRESSDPSKEYAVPRLKTISFDDLQKSSVKPKLMPKRKCTRDTSQPPIPKPTREPRISEAIIREVGDIKTISYNHFVPPPSRSLRVVKRSNLSDTSYSTLSDAKKFARTQTKGIFGNGFGQNFPIVLKSLQLSEASSSSSEFSHE